MNPRKVRVVSLLLLISIFNWIKPVGAIEQFADIKGHWAQEAVLTSVSCDYIKGYPDKTFKPEQQLSQLEALVLFMKTQGYSLDKVSAAKKGTTGQNSAVPKVPWGQNYLNTAVEKQLLPPEWSSFNYNASASRGQVAVLLGRLLGLPNAEPAPETIVFSDLGGVSTEARAYITVLNQKGIINGFADGTFRPDQALKRSEAAVLITKLLQGSWVKNSGSQTSRQMEGWVKSLTLSGKTAGLELASLEGVQSFKLDPGLKCFRNGSECSSQEALNSQVRLYINSKKQVSVISLLDKISSGDAEQYVIGTLKSVLLGEDSLLVLCDLNSKDRRLPLASEASLESIKSQGKGFASLKAGTYVKAFLNGDQVVKVEELETKSMTGTVQKITSNTLYFEDKVATSNKPVSFLNWARARIADKIGQRVATVLRGDKILMKYLDPTLKSLGDEVPLEIILNSRPELKKVKGQVESINNASSNRSITIKKNKYYPVDDSITVSDAVYGTSIPFVNLKAGDKIEMYLDGAGVVMKASFLE